MRNKLVKTEEAYYPGGKFVFATPEVYATPVVLNKIHVVLFSMFLHAGDLCRNIRVFQYGHTIYVQILFEN